MWSFGPYLQVFLLIDRAVPLSFGHKEIIFFGDELNIIDATKVLDIMMGTQPTLKEKSEAGAGIMMRPRPSFQGDPSLT